MLGNTVMAIFMLALLGSLIGCILTYAIVARNNRTHQLQLEYDDFDTGDAPKTLIFKYSPPTVNGRSRTICQRSWREATLARR